MTELENGPERWLPAARAGCPEALGQSLEACRRYLLWVAKRELDPALQAKGGASDLVQETFLDAQRAFDRFQGDSEGELLAWLRRLLLNNLSNFARRYRDTAKRRVADEMSLEVGDLWSDRNPALLDDALSPSDQAIEREQFQLLRQALEKLPEEERRIITMWQHEERSFEEIARMMGHSPNTIRARWLRGIRQLQRELESTA